MKVLRYDLGRFVWGQGVPTHQNDRARFCIASFSDNDLSCTGSNIVTGAYARPPSVGLARKTSAMEQLAVVR